MTKNTHGSINSFLGGLAFSLLCGVLLFRAPVTQIVLGILIGGVAMYVSCLCYVITIRREHGEVEDLLFSKLDGLDDQLEDAAEELAYEKTRDTLFDNVIDTIRLCNDPKAIAAMLSSYDILRDTKNRYITTCAADRLAELDATEEAEAQYGGFTEGPFDPQVQEALALADAAPCLSPT